jgi:hypothetical protein
MRSMVLPRDKEFKRKAKNGRFPTNTLAES